MGKKNEINSRKNYISVLLGTFAKVLQTQTFSGEANVILHFIISMTNILQANAKFLAKVLQVNTMLLRGKQTFCEGMQKMCK